MSAIWSENYKYFRKQIKRARLESGLSQIEVAKALHKPQSYISKCESGERRVDIVELKEFARIYKRPLSYFIKK